MEPLLLDIYNKLKNKYLVVLSDTEPENTDVIWLDTSINKIKYYKDNEWIILDTPKQNIIIGDLPDWTNDL